MTDLVKPVIPCNSSCARRWPLSRVGSFDCIVIGTCPSNDFCTNMIPMNSCWSDLDNIPLGIAEMQAGHYLAENEIARFAGH